MTQSKCTITHRLYLFFPFKPPFIFSPLSVFLLNLFFAIQKLICIKNKLNWKALFNYLTATAVTLCLCPYWPRTHQRWFTTRESSRDNQAIITLLKIKKIIKIMLLHYPELIVFIVFLLVSSCEEVTSYLLMANGKIYSVNLRTVGVSKLTCMQNKSVQIGKHISTFTT